MGAMQSALAKKQSGIGTAGVADRELLTKLASYEVESREKDRLIQEGSEERANLRTELDNSQRALYELQQKHERERREWSEILAKQIRSGDNSNRDNASGSSSSSGGFGAFTQGGSPPLVGRLFKNRGNSGKS